MLRLKLAKAPFQVVERGVSHPLKNRWKKIGEKKPARRPVKISFLRYLEYGRSTPTSVGTQRPTARKGYTSSVQCRGGYLLQLSAPLYSIHAEQFVPRWSERR